MAYRSKLTKVRKLAHPNSFDIENSEIAEASSHQSHVSNSLEFNKTGQGGPTLAAKASSNDILNLQRTLGNRGVQRLLLQRKTASAKPTAVQRVVVNLSKEDDQKAAQNVTMVKDRPFGLDTPPQVALAAPEGHETTDKNGADYSKLKTPVASKLPTEPIILVGHAHSDDTRKGKARTKLEKGWYKEDSEAEATPHQRWLADLHTLNARINSQTNKINDAKQEADKAERAYTKLEIELSSLSSQSEKSNDSLISISEQSDSKNLEKLQQELKELQNTIIRQLNIESESSKELEKLTKQRNNLVQRVPPLQARDNPDWQSINRPAADLTSMPSAGIEGLSEGDLLTHLKRGKLTRQYNGMIFLFSCLSASSDEKTKSLAERMSDKLHSNGYPYIYVKGATGFVASNEKSLASVTQKGHYLESYEHDKELVTERALHAQQPEIIGSSGRATLELIKPRFMRIPQKSSRSLTDTLETIALMGKLLKEIAGSMTGLDMPPAISFNGHN